MTDGEFGLESKEEETGIRIRLIRDMPHPPILSCAVCLGTVRVQCNTEHEMDALRWWSAQTEDSEERRAAFFSGVHVVRDGLLSGLVAARQGELSTIHGQTLAAEVVAAEIRGRSEAEVDRIRLSGERDRLAAELDRFKSASAELITARVAEAEARVSSCERALAAARIEESSRSATRAAAMLESLQIRMDQVEGNRRTESDLLSRALAAERELEDYKKSNHGKGVIGEMLVSTALRARFDRFEVEEKGGGIEAHSQDVWLKIAPSKFVAFESKLKKTITRSDVDKFYADLDAMPGCIGAMMVSLASRNIPGKGGFAVELHAGRRPVLFVGFASVEEFGRFFGDYAQVLVLLSQHAISSDDDASASESATSDAARMSALLRALKPLVDRARRAKNDLLQLGNAIRASGRAVEQLQGTLESLFSDMERAMISASSYSSSCAPASKRRSPPPPRKAAKVPPECKDV